MVCIKLNHIDSNGFDYVAHVTRRVPERLKRLRLPDAVGGLDLQFPRPRALRREGDLPRAKRIFAEVPAQLCFAPGFSAIVRKQDFANAFPAVEGDAFDDRGL